MVWGKPSLTGISEVSRRVGARNNTRWNAFWTKRNGDETNSDEENLSCDSWVTWYWFWGREYGNALKLLLGHTMSQEWLRDEEETYFWCFSSLNELGTPQKIASPGVENLNISGSPILFRRGQFSNPNPHIAWISVLWLLGSASQESCI